MDLLFTVKADWQELEKLREEIGKTRKEMESMSESTPTEEVERITQKYNDLLAKYDDIMSRLGRIGAYIKEINQTISNVRSEESARYGDLESGVNDAASAAEKYLKIEEKINETLRKMRDETKAQGSMPKTIGSDESGDEIQAVNEKIAILDGMIESSDQKVKELRDSLSSIGESGTKEEIDGMVESVKNMGVALDEMKQKTTEGDYMPDDIKAKKAEADELIRIYEEKARVLEEQKTNLKALYEKEEVSVDELREALTRYKAAAEEAGEAAQNAMQGQQEYLDAIAEKSKEVSEDIVNLDLEDAEENLEPLSRTFQALEEGAGAGEVAMGALKDGFANAVEAAKGAAAGLDGLSGSAKAATIATKALGAALKTMGIGLLIAAVTFLVEKLGELVISFFEESEAAKKAREEIEAQEKLYSTTYSKTLSKLVLEYKEMQAEYQNLRNEHEKTEWINENTKQMQKFGASVTDISSAERFFRSETDNIVKSFMLRAQSAAYAAKATKMYEQALKHEAGEEISEKDYDKYFRGADREKNVKIEHGWFGIGTTYKLTQEGAEKLNNFKMEEINKDVQVYINKAAQLAQEAETTLGSLSVKKSKTEKQLLEEQRDNLIRRKKNLTEAQAAGKEGKKIQADIDKLDKRLKAWDTSDKERNKQEKEAEKQATTRGKVSEIKIKERDERVKQAQQTANAVAEAEIAAERNAAVRARKEQDRQHKLNLQQIEDRANDYRKKNYEAEKARWEAQNTDNTKTWADTKTAKDVEKNGYKNISLTKEQNKEIEALNKKENAEYNHILFDRYKAESQAMREYLKEYGDMEQKKAAITEEYEEKIKEAQEAGNTYDVAQLKVKRDEDLKKLSSEELQNKIDWSGVFSDLEGHTIEYLESLRDQLQNLLNEGTLPIDQMAIVQEKLRDVNSEISKQGGLLTFIGDKQREYNRLLQENKQAQERLVAAKNEELGLQGIVESLKVAITELLKGTDLEGVDIDDALETQLDSTSDLFKALIDPLTRLREAEAKLGIARKKTKDATEEAKRTQDKASRDTAQRVADWFSDIQQFISEKGVDQIPDLLGTLGYGTASKKVSAGLDAFGAASGAAADFASGNYIGAALKGISALESFGSVLGIGGESDKYYAEDMERLSKSNERLNESINRLSDNMEKLDIAGISKAYEQQQELLDWQRKNMQEQLQRSLANHDTGTLFKSGDTSAGNEAGKRLTEDQWRRIAQLTGEESITDLVTKINNTNNSLVKNALRTELGYTLGNLTPEQLNKIRNEDAALWEAILEAVSHGHEDASQFLTQYADLVNKEEQLTEDMITNTLNVSFEDMQSNFLDAMMDMKYNAKETAEYITKAMAEALSKDWFMENTKPQLEKLRKELAELYKRRKAGEDVTKEIEDIQRQYVELQNEAAEEGKFIRDITGYTSAAKASQQSATANSIQNISYDQADSLIGIMTAHLITDEQSRNELTFINAKAEQLATGINEQRDISADSRDILAGMAIHVEEIRDGVVETIVPKIKDIDSNLIRIKQLVEEQ